MGSNTDVFARARKLVDDAERAVAGRTEPWRCGTAFFNDAYPVKYALNFLRVDRPCDATAAEMAAEADRVQKDLSHRRINGFAEVEGLAEDFRGLGWDVVKLLFMGHDGTVRHRSSCTVDAVPFETVRQAMIEWTASEENNPTEVAVQLADSRTALIEAIDVTFYAAYIDGRIAGWCEAYLLGDVAQVENVVTLPNFRNRGAASAVVDRALDDAYGRGATFAFLIADYDDWPKDLYERLGFSAIGRMWEFTRT